MYQRNNIQIDLIGIYIDGNNDPFVALIKPGSSFAKQRPLITVGKADNYCEGHYNAVVVIKVQDKLIGNILPFRTTVADCGASNG